MDVRECDKVQELRYQVAFERCVDVMTKLLLKYGPEVLERLDKEKH